MNGFLGAAFRSFCGHILGACGALIAAYSVTSNLSIDESGLFFLSLGFALFFSHFLRLGLDNFVIKKCAILLNENRQSDFLSIVIVSVFVCVLGSAAIYGTIAISDWIISYKFMPYLLLIFPAGVAAALLGIIAHSLHASGYVFTGSVTNTSLFYFIFSILIWVTPDPSAIQAITLFTTACFMALGIQIALALVIYSAKGIKFTQWSTRNFSKVDYHEIYITSFPLWMVVMAQQLNQWGAQFISSVHVSEQELALLAISTRIALLIPMILTAVNMVVSPKFAAHYHKGEMAETEAVLTRSLKLLAVVSMMIFLAIVLFGGDVLSIFGTEYVQAAGILSILVCGQLINGLTGPNGKLLMMSGFERDIRNSSITVTVVGLTLALVLVPEYGVYGAATSTALTIAIQNIALAYLVKHRLKINLLKIYSSFFWARA